MPDIAIVWLVGVVLAAGAIVPFVVRRKRRERAARAAAEKAERAGLHQPASLHPVIDPLRCLGCGACTSVCPEGDVIALVGGQAATIAPARCVGHGRCERVCPTGAISLVFGTETRGVELPRVRGNYMTNVENLYIVGELGGMGLVRNAVEQGRQCAEGIVKDRRTEHEPPEDAFDVVVVGAGPAGMSAAATLEAAGVRYAVLEREAELGGTVRHYPRRKLVMTQPFEIPGYGKIEATEIPKEALMELWTDVSEASGVGLRLRMGHRVTAISRVEDNLLKVESDGGAPVWARRIILAIGRRGTPRKLGVPGEEQSHIVYGLMEPEAYSGRSVLVVGGGDSAVEAAVALADSGAEVRLSYRKPQITRAKADNVARLAEAVARGRIRPLWETEVLAFGPDSAMLTGASGEMRVPADDVFVFIGGEAPVPFLRSCGIEMDTHFGTPRAQNA